MQGDAFFLGGALIDFLQLVFDGIHCRQNIRTARPKYLNAQSRVAVLIGKALFLAAPDMNIGNVAQMHGLAVAPFQNEVTKLRYRVSPAIFKTVSPAPDIDGAAGDVFRPAYLLRHLRNLDSELRGAHRIENDVKFVRAAIGINLRTSYPGNRLQPGQHHILQELHVVIHVPLVAGQLLHEDVEQCRVGILRAGQLDKWLLRVCRKRWHAVEASDNIDERAVHVCAEREGKLDVAAAIAGKAIHLLKAGNALQHIFFRLDDLCFCLAGRFRSPIGLDADRRPVDIREKLDGKSFQRKHAEQNCHGDSNRYRSRILDADRSQCPHRSLTGKSPRSKRACNC